MTGLTYIDTTGGRDFLIRLTEKVKPLGFVRGDGMWYIDNHLLLVAENGRELAQRIIERNLQTVKESELSPEEQYATGLVHDIGNIFEETVFHEVTGAHRVLTQGEEWGLVSGGTPEERKVVLERIAMNIVADGPVFEEWTQEMYAGDKTRTHVVDGELAYERVAGRLYQLRRILSPEEGRFLSMTELLIPKTLAQKVAQTADMSWLPGKDKEGINSFGHMKERFDDIIKRYSDQDHKDYNPIGAMSAKAVYDRYLAVEREVGALAGLEVYQ